jgi:hypothetical protein
VIDDLVFWKALISSARAVKTPEDVVDDGCLVGTETCDMIADLANSKLSRTVGGGEELVDEGGQFSGCVFGWIDRLRVQVCAYLVVLASAQVVTHPTPG